MTVQLERSSVQDPALLARRLDGLHQLLYARGGIKPSNAAVEELAKLLLLRIASERHPDAEVDGYGDLVSVMELIAQGRPEAVEAAKAAFITANSIPAFGSRLPGGGTQPVWPSDEPLRISRVDVICEAVRILWDVELGRVGPYDPIGTAFDVFLRGKYENAGGLGTYLTPEAVVDLMVSVGLELLNGGHSEGSLMGDPCCGTGRFLVGLLHELRGRSQTSTDSDFAKTLLGADQSSSSIAMARVNLMAAGLEAPEVFLVEDSITDTQVSAAVGDLRLILTNPPFGDKKYDSRLGIDMASAVLPQLSGNARVDPALAFVARCIELLAPDGVAGIILPDGVADGPVLRDLLLGQPRLDLDLRLEGVISLPSATFTPAGTTAKTSVVFLRKAAAAPKDRVFMARADHVGYLMRKGAVTEDPGGNDLPEIAKAIVRHLRSGRDLASTLNVTYPRLGELSSIDASSLDVLAGRERFELLGQGGTECAAFLEFCGKRRALLDDGVPFVSVLHVDELGNIDWAQAEAYRPSTAGQIAEPGDVIVSLLNPAKFRAAVVPHDYGPVQCSAEFGVFRSKINPYAALALLQSPQVKLQAAPLGRGTSSSRRRIEPADVLSLVVPPFTETSLAGAGKSALEAFKQIDEGRRRLKEVYEDWIAAPQITGAHTPV